MTAESPRIDPYLFEQHFRAFRAFVENKVKVPFVSFASHPFTEEKEGYKYDIHRSAREALGFHTWRKSDIGSGEIVAATIESIELPGNNLVPWQARYGEEKRPQQPLYEAQNDSAALRTAESALYSLYRDSKEAESFIELTEFLGRKYPLLAYLYFLKDRSRYLPIATTHFDKAFDLLGVDFKTTRRCSWENYSTYNKLIDDIKRMLSDVMSVEVSLLDAHSFAWILSTQMAKQNRLPDVRKYLELSHSEREAIIKARIGQGQFRERLIDYWSTCAVTACTDTRLLRASHIKPWSCCDLTERLDLYNGLLLTPALDLCFDAGLVSFDAEGNILISKQLSDEDLARIGISQEMRLARLEPAHRKYLAYHRGNIFVE